MAERREGEDLNMYKRGKESLLIVLLVLMIVQLLPIKFSISQTVDSYYPSGYNPLGATTNVSGTLSDLQSDDGVYMTFRSYDSATSAQALYAHQETTLIGGSSYYLLKLASADTTGTSLTASAATLGRQLFGKFVYPLTGMSSIPASTWTIYYRAWYSSVTSALITNSPSSQSGAWVNPTYAYADDTNFASSSTNNQQHKFGGYGFSLPTDASIVQVRVRLDVKAATNDKIKLEVSTDGGTTFLATTYTSPALTSTEQTIWVDVTGWTTWTVDKINSDKIWNRVTQVKNAAQDTTYLDWIPVEVTYAALPSAHADVDILIRKSDDTVRTPVASDVATSANLTATPSTLSGTYSWSAYTVVDQTDYLEIDYHLHVTTAIPDITASLRIDDNTLATANQTRAANVLLPSQYTAEVEFTGTSNIQEWAQIVWMVDSAWTAASVSVTLQLYNYATASYPTSGDGYIAYTSSGTPDTDETKSQTITTNPANFRDASGNWKIKIKGVKSTTAQFDFKDDLIKYETTLAVHDIGIVSVTPSPTLVVAGENVSIDVVVKNNGTVTETFFVCVYYDSNLIENRTGVSLASGTQTTLTFSWNTSSVSSGTYTIKAEAPLTGDPSPGDNTYVDGTVTVIKLPVAAFTYSPPTPLVNQTVTFDASSSTPNGGSIVSYAWDFGDGNTGSGMIVNHTYSDGGDFTVTLNITDSEGLWDTESTIVTVMKLPVASFTVSPVSPLAGEAATFDASSSTPNGGSIVSYVWDFGDGNSSWTESDPIAVHVYAAVGNYTVILNITDSEGLWDTESKNVTVTPILYDVAVVSVVPSNTTAYPTWAVPLNITVVVENQGAITVTFNVTVYYDSNPIGTKTVTDLAPGTQATLVFEWNLTGVPPSAVSHAYVPYTIKAEAEILPGETDTADNSLADGTVLVKLPGDANGDGTVNAADFGILGYYWFNIRGFDPRTDFNGDNFINAIDFAILGKHWFESI